MKLIGIGIGGYRCIGEDPIWIDLETKVTVLIGKNNCGKSTVLKALSWISRDSAKVGSLLPIDYHKRDDKCEIHLGLRGRCEPSDGPDWAKDRATLRVVKRVNVDGFRGWDDDELVAASFERLKQIYNSTTEKNLSRVDAPQLAPFMNELRVELHGEMLKKVPEVKVIPQFRQITAGSDYAIGGAGIGSLLARWQNPEIGSEEDKERFNDVQDLLRRLLHDDDIALEVTRDSEEILVLDGSLRLPLESYGTGIHELIILAVAISSFDGVVCCIEEPEIHLHPTLQRELLRFIVEKTSNVYVLTTHSNALITPSDSVQVVHLFSTANGTIGRAVESNRDSLRVLCDLGYRASDILQADAVIWVEGPSDRNYLMEWLKLIAPDLRESIDYSIMFYGGRLLAHVTLERDSALFAEELIPLLRLNQNSVVVIDSDRKESSPNYINATKRRIKEECERNEIYCWITHGKEIENYLPTPRIEDYYAAVTGVRPTLEYGRFDELEASLKKAYGKRWKQKYSYADHKATRSREIAVAMTEEELPANLRRRLEAVASIIREASR